jgi:integrase
MLDRHLIPHFGQRQLADVEAQPELIDAYIALKRTQGLAPKTIQNHLLLLNLMLRRATAWRLIRANPLANVDRPRLEQPEINVLTETEIARLLAAYDQLLQTAAPDQLPWWQLANSIVVTALGTAMRRGELLGLRWRAVDLLEGKVHVREAHIRGQTTTPKSRASRRVIELGPRTRTALEQQGQRARYRDDGNLVFCHPQRGTPLDPSKLSRDYLKPALLAAGLTKRPRPFHDLRHTSLTTPPPPATHRSTCKRAPAMLTHRSPSGTCTQRRSCFQPLLNAPSIESSADAPLEARPPMGLDSAEVRDL